MQGSAPSHDKDLFRRIALGDEEAFAAVFHQYRAPLYNYSFRITKLQVEAEELVQETFLKLWASRENLDSVDNPSSYIFRIARNAAIDFMRRLTTQSQLQNKIWMTISGEEETTLESLDMNETRRILNEAVQQLSFHRRQVFYLSRHKGMSYEEIAGELGIARNTVKNHLVKALKFLREYLEQRYGSVISFIILFFLEDKL